MLLLSNTVRPYAWGPVDGMVALVGTAPSGAPEAELWVGTHPGAPSKVVDDPQGRTLAEVIASDPARWLGPELAAADHTALPFLLKVLAIGSPLSLQAHPSAEQALAGFAREEEAGIPLDAAHRTYRDPHPKPEALVALTETWALCGFRHPLDAAALVEGLPVPTLEPLVATLSAPGPADRALQRALSWLWHLDGAEVDTLLVGVVDRLAGTDLDDLADPRAWVLRLGAAYPGDVAALAPLLMEVVRLDPGQAVHLPAGNLHAYLQGAGVEVMSASDNVLRGGLTSKHVDVGALLDVVRFEPGMPPPPRRGVAGAVEVYDAGEAAFGLVVVDPTAVAGTGRGDGGDAAVVIEPAGPSLLLAAGGPVELAGAEAGVVLDGGLAAFVAPGEGPIRVSGRGRLWWATTGAALPAVARASR